MMDETIYLAAMKQYLGDFTEESTALIPMYFQCREWKVIMEALARKGISKPIEGGERRDVLEALKPFAEAAEGLDPSDEDGWLMWEHPQANCVNVGDFRRAAKAYALASHAPLSESLEP